MTKQMLFCGHPVTAITIQDLYTVRTWWTDANDKTQYTDVALKGLDKKTAIDVLDVALSTCNDEIAAAMITDAMRIVGVV